MKLLPYVLRLVHLGGSSGHLSPCAGAGDGSNSSVDEHFDGVDLLVVCFGCGESK